MHVQSKGGWRGGWLAGWLALARRPAETPPPPWLAQLLGAPLIKGGDQAQHPL